MLHRFLDGLAEDCLRGVRRYHGLCFNCFHLATGAYAWPESALGAFVLAGSPLVPTVGYASFCLPVMPETTYGIGRRRGIGTRY